ncbi:hypothetical protein BDZ97DRAFT_589002 [Flammula alnicola]|nr:hypothetical protein BDZ97DRAFT_589002 [Flammula alnicola]
MYSKHYCVYSIHTYICSCTFFMHLRSSDVDHDRPTGDLPFRLCAVHIKIALAFQLQRPRRLGFLTFVPLVSICYCFCFCRCRYGYGCGYGRSIGRGDSCYDLGVGHSEVDVQRASVRTDSVRRRASISSVDDWIRVCVCGGLGYVRL